MTESKLTAQNLQKSFFQGDKTLEVLKGVNVEFEQARSYAITGVSGSGKSTLMHILGGLDTPSSGQVLFDGQNLNKLRANKKEEIANRHLGFVFQFHYLIKELSVLENIILMGLIKGENKEECMQRGVQLLKKVGLESKINNYPTQLSGGELQRVSILRAIFNKPSFLLADEPTGDLDSQNAAGIVELLLDCKREWNTGLIICSHDSAVYNKMETIFRLHDGKLVEEK